MAWHVMLNLLPQTSEQSPMAGNITRSLRQFFRCVQRRYVSWLGSCYEVDIYW
jgi:hypothetical protein